MNKDKPDWLIELDCPYCGTAIAKGIEWFLLEEDESLTEKQKGGLKENQNLYRKYYYDGGVCEHLAFFSLGLEGVYEIKDK